MDSWTLPGYTTTAELGEGAHGRVVSAVRDRDGRRVAVKYLTDPAHRPVFEAEARHLSCVRSRRVVGLLDYVEADDDAAIVMDLAPGRTLKALLAAQGRLGPQAALLVLRNSLRALSDAHRAGIVHRDFKPGNVLVGERGEITLIDFGIAVREGTRTPSIGTPAYMAPDQWQALPASPGWDLYAAVVVFYECLTGRRPYRSRYIAELAAQHLHAPIPTDGVPAPLVPLIERGLAKDPEDRARSAEELLRLLEPAARRACGLTWQRRARGRFAPVPFALAA